MKIADVQNAISFGCSSITSSVSKAGLWVGHSVQAIGSSSLHAAKKAAEIGGQFFCKAGQLVQTGALASWNFTKAAGSKTAEIAATVGNGILFGAKTVGNKSLEISKTVLHGAAAGAKTVGTAVVDLSRRVACAAAHAISATAHFLGRVLAGAKDGAVVGFQTSKAFLITHQKETLIAGVALTIGLAIGYAASRAYNPAVQTA